MKEEFQVEEEISLLDIIRSLFSKIKLLILVVLVGGLLGGAFAVWRTVDIDYWGSTVEFYVNPEKPKKETGGDGGSQYGVYGAYGRHVMDNMVKLLSSESFAEELILNGSKLPEKGVWVNEENENEVKLALDTKIDNAIAVMATEAEKQAEVATQKTAYDASVSAYDAVMKVLNEKWKVIHSSAGLQSVVFNELEYLSKVKDNGYTEVEEAYQAMKDAVSDVEAKKTALDNATKIAGESAENSEEAITAALEAWRQTAKYKTRLRKYTSAVTYTYLQEDEDIDNANNLARSFIYVEVSVLNDKAFAEDLLQRVKKVVPTYVEENMSVPSDYEGTNCQRITRSDDIVLTNPGYTTKEAIKYAILVAAAFGIIACVIVIIVDRSDKRLKETELLSKKFDMPILGIIPTIDAIASETQTKEAKK